MKNIGIGTPCSENWEGMTSTEKGAFCQKCATEVHDFTQKSNQEIKSMLKRLIGQPVCGRISPAQENALNLEFEEWNFNSKRALQSALIFSLIVVFGLALFSCSSEKEKETIVQIQQSALNSVGEMKTKTENISVNAASGLTPESVKIKQLDLSLHYDKQVINVCTLAKRSYDVDKTLQIEQSEGSFCKDNYTTHGMLGAMVMTTKYEDFLIQDVTPVDPLKEIERDENGKEFPIEYSSKVYPNPVNSIATLELALPQKENLEIYLFDLNGKQLRSVISGEVDRGTFSYQVDMTNYIAGMYLIIIRSKNYNETIRVSKL